MSGAVLHKSGDPTLGSIAMACATCSKWTLIRYFKITPSPPSPFLLYSHMPSFSCTATTLTSSTTAIMCHLGIRPQIPSPHKYYSCRIIRENLSMFCTMHCKAEYTDAILLKPKLERYCVGTWAKSLAILTAFLGLSYDSPGEWCYTVVTYL
jgi:hypothetical protein